MTPETQIENSKPESLSPREQGIALVLLKLTMDWFKAFPSSSPVYLSSEIEKYLKGLEETAFEKSFDAKVSNALNQD